MAQAQLNKGYFGLITAVHFSKETQIIEVIMTQKNGVSRLMKHKVGAREGISKEASRDLWVALHEAMDKDTVVTFYHRGQWRQWFDALEIEEPQEETFEQMIGLTN